MPVARRGARLSPPLFPPRHPSGQDRAGASAPAKPEAAGRPGRPGCPGAGAAPRQGGRRDPRHLTGIPLDPPEPAGREPPPDAPASHASRAATTSSCERPMKFHHMTTSSPNGSPPRTSTRALVPRPSPAPTPDAGRRHHAELGAREVPSRRTTPTRGRRAPPPRNPRRPARRRPPPGASTTSAPTSGVSTRTGDADPHSDPTNTWARTPSATSTTSGAWCSNRGSTSADRRRQHEPQLRAVEHRRARRRHLRVRDAAPGRHEVDLARPHERHRPERVAVLHLPLKSHDTVASPQWGGRDVHAAVSATSSGP